MRPSAVISLEGATHREDIKKIHISLTIWLLEFERRGMLMLMMLLLMSTKKNYFFVDHTNVHETEIDNAKGNNAIMPFFCNVSINVSKL